ncbi:MAG: hypothetical protein ACKVS7_06285 [Gemmatimonadaceae bacterium]
MTERRFSETDAAEIFRRAAELEQAGTQSLAAREGMTLAQLQSYGQEAGLAPELIASAARSLAQDRPPEMRETLGMPIGVRHVVELDAPMSDARWEAFVGELRERFDARGTVAVDGGLRQWTNGNLSVMVEPTPTGSRVRFRTTNARSRALITAGGAMVAASAVTAMVLLSQGVPLDRGAATGISFLALMGVTTFSFGAVPLGRWARARAEQFRKLARQLLGA